MQHDAIVIGGSYAGLSAAMQIARARRSVCVVDAGRPRNRFAAHSHGFFGQDGATPFDMIAQARAKLAAYSTVTFVDDEVVAARRDDDGLFSVDLATREKRRATKLVLATGGEDVLPDVLGLAERWGASVLHCPYCHGYEFGGRPLGVLNVAPLSIHQALMIPDWGPTTFFLNGGDPPDAEGLRKLAQRGVIVEPATVVAVEGSGPTMAGLRMADGRLVEIDALFLGTQLRITPLAAQLGCEFEDGPFGPFIRVDAAKMTTVLGVYAAGDNARAMHNATFASADGVLAGASLHQALMLDPLTA